MWLIDKLLGRTDARRKREEKLDAAIEEMEVYLEERRRASERPTSPGLRDRIDSAADLALEGLEGLRDHGKRRHAR